MNVFSRSIIIFATSLCSGIKNQLKSYFDACFYQSYQPIFSCGIINISLNYTIMKYFVKPQNIFIVYFLHLKPEFNQILIAEATAAVFNLTFLTNCFLFLMLANNEVDDEMYCFDPAF